MKWWRVLRFAIASLRDGMAYIDCDGCILKRFPVPEAVEDKLAWWIANLAPTPRITSRLVFLWALRRLGVTLVLWTDRSPQHEPVTVAALGPYAKLFQWMEFHGGVKKLNRRPQGPVMDDKPEYVALGLGGGLLVESL